MPPGLKVTLCSVAAEGHRIVLALDYQRRSADANY